MAWISPTAAPFRPRYVWVGSLSMHPSLAIFLPPSSPGLARPSCLAHPSPLPPTTQTQTQLRGIDFTVALDQPQFNVGGCGMCIELTGTGTGAGGNPVTGTYTVFVNNLCPECEFGHLDFATPGDGSWDIVWYVCLFGGDRRSAPR